MNLSRFSLNQATIKYSSLEDALRITAGAGIPAIGVWRESIAERGLASSARIIKASGLRVSSLLRGGFFTDLPGRSRTLAIDENRRAIEEAQTIGAPCLVLVAGGLPAGSRDLIGARDRVADALAELVDDASAAGVVLAIEALHPMYAADRAVVSTLGQALDIAELFPPSQVGVVIDTFHVWWDPSILNQICRAGDGGRIASYQVCDWVTPIASDPLLSRGYPGDGHIDFAKITDVVLATGYAGDIEMEIFRQEVWDADPTSVAQKAVETYTALIGR